jgi:hypothetical protein
VNEYKSQLTELTDQIKQCQEILQRQEKELQAARMGVGPSTGGYTTTPMPESQAPQSRPDMMAYRGNEDAHMTDDDSESTDEQYWTTMTGRKTQDNAGSRDAGSWEEELDIEVEENDNAQSKVGLKPGELKIPLIQRV